MKKEKMAKKENKFLSKLSKKQKGILFGVASFVASFAVTAILILSFTVFIPQASISGQKSKYNSAVTLLNSGNYEEAAASFKNLIYSDSQNLYYVAKAGACFEKDDYESGIQNIHDAGGSVYVHYDSQGGTMSTNREVLSIKKKWIEKTPVRNGYEFISWNIASFTLSNNEKDYDANLNLIAKWNILNYTITYNLNGATLNNLPIEYNVDTPSFSLGRPEKTGYTFKGWSGTDIEGTSFNVNIKQGSIGNRNYTANFEANKYTITYDFGYNDLSDMQQVTYDSAYTLMEPTRVGYTFDGWYYLGQKLESGNWNIDNNITLVAKWTLNTYRLTFWNPNEERGTLRGSGSYTHGTEVTVIAVANKGYTFLGWYLGNELVCKTEKYTFTITSDLELSVRWSAGNIYTVTLDPNGGEISDTVVKVQYGEHYILYAPTRIGYQFEGWYDGDEIVLTYGNWNYDSDKNLVARWSIANYVINYRLHEGTNSPNNPSTYTYFESVELHDPEREGYAFLGWYLNDVKIETIPEGSYGSIILDSRWSANKNALVVTSEDTSKGTVTIEEGSGYTDERITVKAIALDGYSFLGWDDGTSIISRQATYSFIMPTHDCTLTAHFSDASSEQLGTTPRVEGNNVIYGLYPQTHVNDAALIVELEKLSTDSLVNNWVFYNKEYYCKETPKHNSGYFDDNEEFTNGNPYWFKCEPIKWDVVTTDENGVMLTSHELLDSYTFEGTPAQSSRTRAIYAQSDIRTWLNFTFYNTAFALNSDYIQKTTVNNGPETTDSLDNQNCCVNTEDNVFLLSYYDCENYFTMENRMCYLTDYARTRNDVTWTMDVETRNPNSKTRCYSSYYTRSPYSLDSANLVVMYVEEYGDIGKSYTYVTRGVRPCIYLNWNWFDSIEPLEG